jgi:hypothetical protein
MPSEAVEQALPSSRHELVDVPTDQCARVVAIPPASVPLLR